MKRMSCIIPTLWACSLLVAAASGAVSSTAPSTAPSVEKQVAAYLDEQDFVKASDIVKTWKTVGADQKIAIMEELEKNLNSTKVIALTNTADMVVVSRLAQGTMVFQGHGLLLKQDVFVTGGKAAWAIEVMLGVHVPAIVEKMTEEDRSSNVSQIKAVVTAYKKGVAGARNAKQE